jgi:hypothetical protein
MSAPAPLVPRVALAATLLLATACGPLIAGRIATANAGPGAPVAVHHAGAGELDSAPTGPGPDAPEHVHHDTSCPWCALARWLPGAPTAMGSDDAHVAAGAPPVASVPRPPILAANARSRAPPLDG